MTVTDAAQWASRDVPGGQPVPSAFHPDRLKALRTEHGWSQAELAERIDSDARQVSRYENGKVAPGLEAVIRISETFNVSVDYLVIEDAARRPLHAPENALADQLADFAQLDPDDQGALLKILDALITKTRLRAITGGIS